jgi:hyperosmotically inducible periplasmic protein
MKFLVARLSGASVLLVLLLFSGLPARAVAQNTHEMHAATRKANHKLEREVRSALSKNQVDVADIQIVAKNGKVILEGGVPDASQIQLAETAAENVQGVASVDNHLKLHEPGH